MIFDPTVGECRALAFVLGGSRGQRPWSSDPPALEGRPEAPPERPPPG